MKIVTEAWTLHPAKDPRNPERAELRRETLEFSPPEGDEVLLEPLYGSWEANMSHALQRRPIDICVARKEPRVVIGNGGVARVVRVGDGVKHLRVGDVVTFMGLVKKDQWGYPIKLFGYDAPGTVGVLAKQLKAKEDWVIKLPENTRHPLAQWAAFQVRYISAWSNWELAYGTFRLQVREHELPTLNVWGWGGGTSFAFVDLARRLGHKTAMLSSSRDRLSLIHRHGIDAVNRRELEALDYGAVERDGGATPELAERYKAAEQQFLAEVARRTGGIGVQIFIEMLGTPVYRATLKALGRQGIITTAGWKHGMKLWNLRAVECISRHQHIHTHYARRGQADDAIAYGEAEGWMPPVDEKIYAFDDIPGMAADYEAGKLGMFPCFRVNPE